MVDLSINLAGIRLKNPLIVASGPNTKNITTAINCAKAGFGGIVVRSLHQEHLNQKQKPLRNFWNIYSTSNNFTKTVYSLQSTGTRTSNPLVNVPLGWGGAARIPNLEEWTEEVHKIKCALKIYDCAVIAQIGWCGSSFSDDDVWQNEPKMMAQAEVDGIELHTSPSPGAEPGRYLTINPSKYLIKPIQFAKESSNGLPVFAKLASDCCDPIALACIAQKAGADGIVPATRWSSITIDVNNENDHVLRGPGIGGPWSAPIMNSLIFRMRKADRSLKDMVPGSKQYLPNNVPVTIPIVASGGVQSGETVIGYLLAGATAAQVCSQVILEGPQVAGRFEKEMREWMEKRGCQKISDFQGTLQLISPEEMLRIPWWIPKVDDKLCTGCGKCVKACANEAMSLKDDIAFLDASYCEGCRTCYYVCPENAISLDRRDH